MLECLAGLLLGKGASILYYVVQELKPEGCHFKEAVFGQYMGKSCTNERILAQCFPNFGCV